MRLPLKLRESTVMKYLNLCEKCATREWCRACNTDFKQMKSIELVKRRKFYALARSIDKLSKLSPANYVNLFKEQLQQLKLKKYMQQFTRQDIFYVEKILVEITKTGPGPVCTVIANALFDHLGLDPVLIGASTRYRQFELMQLMLNSDLIELFDLTKMFDYGVEEWGITDNKYNRYTKFAFNQMDILLDRSTGRSPRFTQRLWDDIAHIAFLEDYLKRDKLLNHRSHAKKAIQLIITDAIDTNVTFNNHYYSKFMISHSRLFFDLEIALNAVQTTTNGSADIMVQLMAFMLDNDLILWGKMLEQLNSVAFKEIRRKSPLLLHKIQYHVAEKAQRIYLPGIPDMFYDEGDANQARIEIQGIQKQKRNNTKCVSCCDIM